MVDIPRIKFFAQRRYRANWPFVDGHQLPDEGDGFAKKLDSLCKAETNWMPIALDADSIPKPESNRPMSLKKAIIHIF
jgi:hypothetical protein